MPFFSLLVSAFLFWPREKVPKPYVPLTEDHERMLEALKTCDREWVAILPPHIAGTFFRFLAIALMFVKNY